MPMSGAVRGSGIHFKFEIVIAGTDITHSLTMRFRISLAPLAAAIRLRPGAHRTHFLALRRIGAGQHVPKRAPLMLSHMACSEAPYQILTISNNLGHVYLCSWFFTEEVRNVETLFHDAIKFMFGVADLIGRKKKK